MGIISLITHHKQLRSDWQLAILLSSGSNTSQSFTDNGCSYSIDPLGDRYIQVLVTQYHLDRG